MTSRDQNSRYLGDKLKAIREALDTFRAKIPRDQKLPPRIVELQDYIHCHFCDPSLNVNSALAGCRISNHNFPTSFRARIGLSIREYIEDLRIKAACVLLRDAGVEVYLVAVSVGYEHPETFYRAFRRYLGRTPSEFQQLSRKSTRDSGEEMRG